MESTSAWRPGMKPVSPGIDSPVRRCAASTIASTSKPTSGPASINSTLDSAPQPRLCGRVPAGFEPVLMPVWLSYAARA